MVVVSAVALEYLSKVAYCRIFINAGLIVADLSPLAPEGQLISASRIFLHQIEMHIEKGQDLVFETTLAGISYLKLIDRIKKGLENRTCLSGVTQHRNVEVTGS